MGRLGGGVAKLGEDGDGAAGAEHVVADGEHGGIVLHHAHCGAPLAPFHAHPSLAPCRNALAFTHQPARLCLHLQLSVCFVMEGDVPGRHECVLCVCE